jgi:hypothetical protein
LGESPLQTPAVVEMDVMIGLAALAGISNACIGTAANVAPADQPVHPFGTLYGADASDNCLAGRKAEPRGD